MKIEDIKEPCVECFHEPSCVIRHPELAKGQPNHSVNMSCEKLNKFSSYLDATRPYHY